MRHATTILLSLVALAGLPAAAAQADVLLTPASSAVNLAAGGGYAVWATPNEDTGWHLVVRAPGGTVSVPRVGDFPGPPIVAVGSDAFAAGRSLLAVYSRRSGSNDDIYALNLRTGVEHKVGPISSTKYDETAPSVQYGRFAFVRRGGSRSGIYSWTPGHSARRLSRATPAQTAVSEARVAYPATRNVIVRRLSGQGNAIVLPSPASPRSVVINRYRAGWLIDGGRVFLSPRYAGSGGPYHVDHADEATRRLPASTQSIAFENDRLRLYLDATGLNRADPPLFRGQ